MAAPLIMTETNTGIRNLQQQRQKLISALTGLQELLSYQAFDLVVSHCEVNHRHGSGILLKRIFQNNQQVFSLRSRNLYDGEQDFGVRSVCIQGSEKSKIAFQVRSLLADCAPQRLLVAPYFANDFKMALAIKQLYDIPVGLFIMDDQNIFSTAVPDALVQALVDQADLCLGISPALCQAYEDKFKRPFWFVPPVVDGRLRLPYPNLPQGNESQPTGIMIGNIWSQQWLDKLRLLCRQTGVKLNWYGNIDRRWLVFDEETLQADGITYGGYLGQEALIGALRQAPFAVIPTGESTEPEDRPELAQLSLPSRSCFMVVCANIPLLVVGAQDTAIAQFVKDNRLGSVSPFEAAAFQRAVTNICEPSNQTLHRQAAFTLSDVLATDDLEQWIWASLEKKCPIDWRFEALASNHSLENASMIITCSEVTQKHGTGALVRRIFPEDQGIISLRSDNHYGGDHQFGELSYYFPCREYSRQEIFALVCQKLAHHRVKRVFCVPYYSADLLLAIAVKELFGVPMATYIMDDQNICAPHIPDALMKEFLGKCDVRFATHPELRDAYQEKYHYPFWILPAIVPDNLVTTVLHQPSPSRVAERRGALIGSIWSQKWYQCLGETIQGSGNPVDWYGNANYYWFQDSHADMLAKGINHQGLFPERELVAQLRQYPYVVVPTGTLDERDDQPHLSQLSLPGRIIFAMASSNTPILLLGSDRSSAANFIHCFQIGVVSDYNPESFRAAVDCLLDPENQRQMRQNAVKVAKNFSDYQIDQWVWEALRLGKADPARFENLLTSSYGLA